MRQREDTEGKVATPEGQQAARKPYVKPAVRHEQVFETRALSCGKVYTTQSECRLSRRTS